QLAGIQTQAGTIALQVREGNLTLNPSENPLQPILQTVDSGDLILEAAQINLYSPVQSAGAQTYQGNLILGTDIQLKSTQQGAIVFQGTIDSDQSATPRNLSVETEGVTQFNGAIGSISPLATLETDAQGGVAEQTIFNSNLVQTIANQRFQDPVQLVQTIQLNGQEIVFGNTLEAQPEGQEIELGVNADRFLAQGSIGAQNPLSSLRINTQGTLQLQGNSHSIHTLALTSQNGFIETGNLQTQGGTVALETQGLTTTVTNQPGIQPGDIQVGAIQTQGGSINISVQRLFQSTTVTPIEGDRLALRAETLGTKDQPLFTQVNALSTDTALSNGDQFLVNLQGLTSLNLNAGTEGFLSLTVQGAILDADPDLDVQAATLKLDTLGGIGTIDSPLQTAVQTIAAQASQTGGIAIQNQNNLNVATVDQLAGIQTQAGTIALQVREGNLTLNSSENPLQPLLKTANSGAIILEAPQINLHRPVQSAGAQTYQGNLVLGTDVQLKSTQQGAIVFQGTIDSDQRATPRNLSIETGGVTQFNGAIGSISPLATLETDAQGGVTEQTIFNTNLIQTIANQRFQDPVQLVQSIQFNGQEIVFGNTLEGQPEGQEIELGVNADRFLTQGTIGAQNPLSSLRINTQGILQIQGNTHSIHNLALTSQEGFIETKNLQTQGGNVTLETVGLTTTVTNQPGIQPGDIQVGAIQTRGGSVNISAKRFFRATDSLNGASISTIGSNNGEITIVHGGGLLNQPFIVGDPNRSNNGVSGTLRTNIATVPGIQAFLGSVRGGNVQILAGRDNPPVNVQFIPPSLGNSLTASIHNVSTPLETIEDINTLEFQNAFGQ
ncbi:MAG: hypothetical protein ACO3EZ_17605, partial [Prochlorotrichaceae cyanobacterium]